MTALRRWAARARWRADVAEVGHVGALRRAVGRLVREYPQESLAAARGYGTAVREQHGVGVARQCAESWWLRVRYDLSPAAYYRFQLYRAERWRQRALWVPGAQAGRLVRLAARGAPAQARCHEFEKARFERWCGRHGLACIPTLGVLDAARGAAGGAGGGAIDLPAVSLFSKPTNAQAGAGARRWVAVGAQRWREDGGVELDAAALCAELMRQSAELGRPILVQPFVANHPALQSLSRGGLATLRMLTLREPGAPSVVLCGILRLPAGDSATDNFDGGGLAADVSLDGARVGPALRKSAAAACERHAVHPDTGGRIEGAVVPHWAGVLALVRRGHDALEEGHPPLIGWDVAVTENGPVLVEANNIPCSVGLQMVTGRPLGATAYPAAMLAYLNRHLPQG